ncbi:unnamed protein product [Lactuca saligna]|uniref:Uncharacterized protein n=1 Tax=Lactuca saligna TaxID=75948 RepID=A0AA35ZQ62_LACSI|nr:unnamed protein product [Lactuca saligna]
MEGPSEPTNTPKKQKSDVWNEEKQPILNEEEEQVHNEEATSNPEVTPTYNDFFPSPPRSLEHTTTPITIAQCPPPVSSQLQSTIPLYIPFFTDSTVPPTTSGEPVVSVNASDVGARTSGFTSSHISPPISPMHRDDPDMIYGDDEDDLAGFTFSLFIIQTASDDVAYVTKGKLKAIHEKLDSLLQASKPSSSHDYSQASIMSIIETLTKEYSSNLEKMNKAVDASTLVYNKTTEKVNKLISDAICFMNNFSSSFETNTTRANEVLANLGSSLQAKRAKLQEFRTIIVRKHLAEKQRPVFAMLHRLEGFRNLPKIKGEIN